MPPSRALRLASVPVAAILGVALAELIARSLSGGALPRLALFREHAGRIELRPEAEGALRHPTGRVTVVHTDALGCRAGGAHGGWLVVGDSQVMGQGVADDETFAARAAAAGVPVVNCGVPGHGVEDALAHADGRTGAVGARGVLVVVNQLNDWEEAGKPALERVAVRGGFLVTRANADGLAGRLLASPLAGSNVVLGLLLVTASTRSEPPLALRDPASVAPATARIAAALGAYAEAHPSLRTVALLLPADIEAAPARGARSAAWFEGFEPGGWDGLRASLVAALPGVETIDLTPALASRADAFLDADTHLSPVGHALVADALGEALR